MHHVEGQVGIGVQNQHLDCFIEGLRQRSDRCALSMDPKPDFDFGLLELFDHAGVELEVEDPHPELAVPGGVEGDLELGHAHLFVLVVEQIALDRMCAALVLEEGIHIVAALSDLLFAFVAADD